MKKQEIDNLIKNINKDWNVVENSIKRDFFFKDFKYAFKFMSDVAVVAEEINHHPTWTNTYNRLEIILTTHDTGGISKLDFELAKRIDVIFEKSK
tara:strand:- start:252 stop:536 length:285 start_codon:yes stop_codon:yes gene_type:complete